MSVSLHLSEGLGVDHVQDNILLRVRADLLSTQALSASFLLKKYITESYPQGPFQMTAP